MLVDADAVRWARLAVPPVARAGRLAARDAVALLAAAVLLRALPRAADLPLGRLAFALLEEPVPVRLPLRGAGWLAISPLALCR